MSRASEAIRAHDGRWSPIGASEVVEAARLAKEVACGSQTRETQAMQAYMFLASIRDSERLTAVASNADVAAHVLTKDGSGTVSGTNYRRYTKNDLDYAGWSISRAAREGVKRQRSTRSPLSCGCTALWITWGQQPMNPLSHVPANWYKTRMICTG